MSFKSLQFFLLFILLDSARGRHNAPAGHGRFEVETIDTQVLEGLEFDEGEIVWVESVEVEWFFDANLPDG